MDKELERLAREAGLGQFTGDDRWELGPQLERFALLVEQRAMERAAKVCEARYRQAPLVDEETCDACAAAIRSSAPRANGGEG